uniref:Uncharacterized protein n=1 Tax=Rhizophora mucronata TaxID=61149 RepID=A0A2P2QX93_RHIMU
MHIIHHVFSLPCTTLVGLVAFVHRISNFPLSIFTLGCSTS